jgi:hypothetical protein
VILEKDAEDLLDRSWESRRTGSSLRPRKRKKANWIGHVWRRNCRIQHVIEGKIEGRSGGKTRKKT